MIIVRLNGWQRLWMVVSVLSLVATLTIVFSELRDADQIDDAAFHAQRLAKEVTVVEIAGIGTVTFPNDLTTEEISSHVKRGMSTSPPTVLTIAKQLRELRAKREAALASAKNRLARSENQRTWVYGIGGWLAFVGALYLFGWAVGWVLRGFRAT